MDKSISCSSQRRITIPHGVTRSVSAILLEFKYMFAPNEGLGCESGSILSFPAHYGLATVRTGCFNNPFPARSIHLREKNIAGPTERSRRRLAACISRFTLDVGRSPKCLPFVRARIRHLGLSPTQGRREGPAFFDEDDACAGFRSYVAACPNCRGAWI